MSEPKALVLRSAGTNCEDETCRALTLAGAKTDLIHFRRLVENPGRLSEYRIVVVPGGFSFGDDIAAGRVWGAELRAHLAREFRGFVDGGGLILGVCNGFQVILEAGLFEPDKKPEERSIALYENASNHYECRWIHLETQDTVCPWLVPGERFPTPVAHAEGRFVVRDASSLKRLIEGRQVALTYVNEDGSPPEYPADPNGSVHHIAGICDPTGRVLGLMPHPERNITPQNHPQWTRLPKREEGEGLSFYRRMVETATPAPV